MAKKVNKKFLVGLIAVVGGLAVVGFGLVILSRHSASFYARRADAELGRGELNAAAGDLSHAISKDRGNKELYLKLGDVYNRMVLQDPMYLSKAVGVWKLLLEMDPGCVPAIDRLLNERIDEMKAGTNDPASFAELRRLAQAAVKADPSNPKYQAMLHIATVRQWLGGAALGDQAVAKDVTALAQLAEKNPDDADAGFWAGDGQLKQARDLFNHGKADQAHAMLDQIAAREQSLTKARPQSPAVQLRAFQISSGLLMLDDRSDRRSQYESLRDQSIATAHAHATPAGELYDDTQAAYLAWLAGRNAPRPEQAKVYRAWAQARPGDLRARNALAEFLGADPSTRAEAIKLLGSPLPDEHSLQGVQAAMARHYERTSLITLNTLRVDDARAAAPAEKAALLEKIQADLPRITAMGNTADFPLLKLTGKVQMLQSNPVEAIKTFERARTLLGSGFDPDLWANLEQAYAITNQTGTVEQMLEQLIARMPHNSAARLQLAEMYLNTGQTNEASAQLDRIDATPSNSAQITAGSARLRIAVLARQNHPDQARERLAAMPEKTRTDRIFKARLAADIGNSADALRLYTLVLHDNAADGQALTAAVDIALREDHRAQAQELVAGALKAKPDDKGLAALRERLAASTPEQLKQWLDQTIQQTADPFVRDLRLAQVAMGSGDFADAARQLDGAEKIKPDDPRLMDLRLQWYVRQGKFDQAMPLVERAAKANADRMDGLSIRSHFALDRGDVVSALKWGNQLVGKHGEFAANWVLLGQVQQAAGRYGEAMSSFNSALTRQPNNIDALRYKAACLESLGEFADEKATIDLASSMAPGDVNVRDQRLNFELHHGDPDKVIASCQDLLKNDPGNASVYTALGQAYEVAAESKYRGDAGKAHTYMEQARDVLKTGMAKFAKTPDAAHFYPPLAQAFEGLGDPASAEAVLRQFADLPSEKGKPAAARDLAVFLERYGHIQDAEQAWRDAYAKAGDDVAHELDLASFLVRRHRVDEALKVLEANAADPRVINQKIETLMGSGKLAQARAIVDQLLAANGSDSAAMYYRGVLELAQGDALAAVNDLTALRNKTPQNVQVRLWLARALIKRGRQSDAIVELETALKRSPLHSDVRAELLAAYSSADPPRWGDFDRVVQEAQNNPVLNVNPQWDQIDAHGLARRGQFDSAVQQMASARKLAPKNLSLWQDQVGILVQARKWQDALDQTDQQLAAGVKNGMLYGQRAAARAGLKDKAGALKELDTGLALDLTAGNSNEVAALLRMMGELVSPDEALSRLAKFPAGPGRDLLAMDLYGMKGDSANQAKAAESALEHPDQLSIEQKTHATRTEAEAYLGLSQWDKARAAYDRLLKLHPNDIPTLNNVAYLTAEVMKDPHAAKAYSSRAYDLATRSGGMPDISDTHGWVLTLCGGRDALAGLGILQNLVETDKNFTKARYHLAEAYLRSGNFGAAGNQLAIVQQQINQMKQNHQPIDSELNAGLQKALQQVQEKSGLKSSASSR